MDKTNKKKTKKLDHVDLDDLEAASGGCAACGQANGGTSGMLPGLAMQLLSSQRR